jgi:hypothetical protein
MKHLPFFAFLAFLFAGIFACTQSAPAPEAAKPILGDPQAALTALSKHEISAAKATAAMAEWDTARSVIVPVLAANPATRPDAKYIAKGFKIPMADLQSIIAAIGDTSKLFAMLAIQDTTVTVIFQMPDKANTVRYYDFTKPCPTDCPN